MKYLQTFDGYLNEAIIKPYVDPEILIAQGIAATNTKIAALKQQMMDKPEQRDIILAKMNVEMEKIDMLQAKKNLVVAKELEDKRKEREKMQKMRDKAAAARQKERSK